MSKKLNNLNWSSVAVDGFPVSMAEKFDGFVGLEECTDYGMDKENSRSKKKKQQKRKSTDIEKTEVPSKKVKETNNKKNKKVKLSNGFIVEVCTSTTPSLTNEISPIKSKIKKQKSLESNNYNISNKKTNNKKQKLSTLARVDEKENDKNNKPKLGDLPQSTSDLTSEDMLTWAEFKLPEPIIKALTELGFKQPTKIQQLTLPAAIHGRRDILGAAETGSGKTLAFGLPILTGILKLKEKAETKGLNIYDIPYKKNSNKNKIADEKQIKKKEAKTNFVKNKKKTEVTKCKESSEDDCNGSDDNDLNSDDKEKSNDKDFIEEIEVPIRKRKPSGDEGNDSDNDNNYIHLSDMLDSNDLAETSSDEDSDENNEINQDDRASDKCSENDADVKGDINSDDSIVDEEIPDVKKKYESDNNDMEVDEHREDYDNKQGIGCVKVLDDVEIPGQVVTRTGKPLYALILTPTRELAIQISRHLIAAAKYTGIRVATIVGGMAAVKQERVLRSGPEVVVATPGRLWELINEGQPHLQQLDSVKFLAIDETDRMIERGHFEELHPLLERLNVDDASRSARQNFVFSATLTMVHALPAHMKSKKVTKRGKIINRKIEKMTSQQKVNRLIKMIGMTDPKVVDITTENLGTAETLTESRIICEMEHKDAYLYYIVKRHPGRTIVFCNSISSVKRLAQLLKLLNCHPLPLHANMPQRQRLKNLERFRDDRHGILIATDVAARGLDIPRVDHVIHYQVPRTAENYVHRSGRTARASNEGLAVLMLQPSEAALYSRMCSTLQRTSEVPIFPVDPLILAPLKELVAVARDLDALEVKKRRSAQAHGWRDRAAREMDIIIDDDDVPVKQVDPSIDKALQAKRRQLNTLLSCPIYPRGFSFKYPTLNETTTFSASEENALQVMKKALETGQIKKQKRQSKNASLLQLQKAFKK